MMNLSKLLKNLSQATIYSFAGLKAAVNTQWAFRAELLLLTIAIPVAFFLGVTTMQRILLISSILLVLIVELVNSAIETIVDRISMERHVLSGRAKDLGSAAVFIAVINAVIVWLFIFMSRFF